MYGYTPQFTFQRAEKWGSDWGGLYTLVVKCFLFLTTVYLSTVPATLSYQPVYRPNIGEVEVNFFGLGVYAVSDKKKRGIKLNPRMYKIEFTTIGGEIHKSSKCKDILPKNIGRRATQCLDTKKVR